MKIDPHAAHHDNCECCGKTHFQKSLDEMTLDVFTREVAKIVTDESRVLAIKEESGEPDFVEEELMIALILGLSVATVADIVELMIREELDRPLYNSDRIYGRINDAEAYWRNNTFNNETSVDVQRSLERAVALGVVAASPSARVEGDFRQRIVQGMLRSSKYYTNAYFNTQVMPALISLVGNALSSTDTAAGFQDVREFLSKRLRSVPYWKLVANAAASRSYHYGLLKGGQAIGRTTVRFVAVMDERTSAICEEMNGTEWSIETAVAHVERIAALENPDDIKNVAPWVRAEDVKGRNPAELAEMGVIVPPLHGNCRSELMLA